MTTYDFEAAEVGEWLDATRVRLSGQASPRYAAPCTVTEYVEDETLALIGFLDEEQHFQVYVGNLALVDGVIDVGLAKHEIITGRHEGAATTVVVPFKSPAKPIRQTLGVSPHG